MPVFQQNSNQEMSISRVTTSLEAIKKGGMVIMVDDEDRENEGDLVCAASLVTPQIINFMTKEARGLVCLAMDAHFIDRLKLPMMEDFSRKVGNKSTAFTVSIEARHGVTTGISAADRAHTIRVASDLESSPDDIVVPGHVFPLKARPGGVLERGGHTEGSVDLTYLAGLPKAAVICEIMNDDGSMARRDDLEKFALKHNLPILSIADLIAYRLSRESLVILEKRSSIQTRYGEFELILFRTLVDQNRHLALVKGEPSPSRITDVRVHRQKILSDLFSPCKLEPPSVFLYGFKMLEKVEHGVYLYLTHQNQAADLIGDFDYLVQKSTQHPVSPNQDSQAQKRPWVETDPLTLGVGAQILRQLGVRKMRVHMTRPMPLKGLLGYDLEVAETITIP
jgi:3,4-dihydroxy 2-butanone 4-phosphate synthase/GTP cyclohydrolase II